MQHESMREHGTVELGSNRGFGGVFTAVFLIVGLWPMIDGQSPYYWSLIVAGIILTVSAIRPVLLAPLNRFWFKFGMILHHIVSPLVMGMIFYCTVTPTALIFKLLRKDPLLLRRDPEAKTYWVPRDDERSGSMTDQF